MLTLIYLHGFLSSPLSKKAQSTKAWLREHYPAIDYQCPALSSYPAEAKQQLDALINDHSLAALGQAGQVGLIGSSLGGFWSTYLVERYPQQLKAVLVNPAVAPHTRFKEFHNKPLKSYYSDTVYTLQDKDADLLEALDEPTLKSSANYKLLLQTGDETLDYRLAAQRYRHCDITIEEGGNHSFTGFEDHLPACVQFLLG